MKTAPHPFRKIELFRIAGLFVDADDISWFDTGRRAGDGARIYTDGASLAIRAGSELRSKDIVATELGA